MMNYDFLMGVNFALIFAVALIAVLGGIVAKKMNWKIAAALVVVGFVGVYFLGGELYEKQVGRDASLLIFKQSIESGANNDFTEKWNHMTDAQKAALNSEIERMDKKRAAVGVHFGYGAADMDKMPLALFLGSLKGQNFAPLFVPLVLLALAFGGLKVGTSGAAAIEKSKVKLQEELEHIDSKIKIKKNELKEIENERLLQREEFQKEKKKFEELKKEKEEFEEWKKEKEEFEKWKKERRQEKEKEAEKIEMVINKRQNELGIKGYEI